MTEAAPELDPIRVTAEALPGITVVGFVAYVKYFDADDQVHYQRMTNAGLLPELAAQIEAKAKPPTGPPAKSPARRPKNGAK